MLPILENAPRPQRCSGHCCRDFTLPFTPGELHRLAKVDRVLEHLEAADDIQVVYPTLEDENYHFRFETAEAGQLHERLTRDLGPDPFKGHRRLMDVQQIADMVIHNGYKTDEGLKRWYDAETERAVKSEMKHHYSCKHQQQNGDCGIYWNRPRMCSDFPYGPTCDQIGCTSAEGEAFGKIQSTT